MKTTFQVEQLEERALLAGDMMQVHHEDIPDYAMNPTVVTIADGNWSDGSIWSTGRAPGEGDVVRISSHVTYDTKSLAELDAIVIDVGGNLDFNPNLHTQLVVGTLEVLHGGTLTVGTDTKPITATAEIIFADQAIDTMFDPMQYGTGLVSMGNVSMHGLQKTDYVRLATELSAGQTTITLEEPVSGWKVGDKLFFADTRQYIINVVRESQDEIRSIASISADGRTVTLDSALSYSHKGARDGNDALVFTPYVANLTRNVVLRSENPNGTRAHTMYTGHGAVDIEYVGFYDMGRTTNDPLNSTKTDSMGMVTSVGTNQIARYAVHMHHQTAPHKLVDGQYRFVLEGNAIYSTVPVSRWGITVHASHYGLVKDNVVVSVAGAGIVTENGNETGTIFEGNFVSAVHGNGSRPDGRIGEIGFEGSAFWFRGGNNIVRDNVASGSNDGFVYYARFTTVQQRPVSAASDDQVSIDPYSTAIPEFSGNEVAGNVRNGFSAWWIGAIDRTPVANMATSVIKDFDIWHVASGVSGYEVGNFIFDTVTILGDRSLANEFNGGMGFSDYLQSDVILRNVNIQNFSSGIRTPAISEGLNVSGTNPGLFIIEDSYLRNYTNLDVGGGWHNATAKGLSPIIVLVDNVRFAEINRGGEKANIKMGAFGGEFASYTQWVALFVKDYNGVVGDNFQVFSTKQAASFIVPQSSTNGRVVGAPVAGLTNEVAWANYGLAMLGGITPTTATRTGIQGYVLQQGLNTPVIQPIANRTFAPGQEVSLAISAFNPYLRDLKFSLENAPAGMNIDAKAGVLTWTTSVGVYNVTLRVTDSADSRLTATTQFTYSVNGIGPVAPAASIAGPTTTVRGAPTEFVLSYMDGSPAPAGGYRFSIDWDGNGTVDQVVTGQSGMVVKKYFGIEGNYNVRVTATNPINGKSSGASTPLTVKAWDYVKDPANSSITNVVWGGSGGSDVYTFVPGGVFTSQEYGRTLGTPSYTGFGSFNGKIIVHAQGGNDFIYGDTVATPLFIYGGDGNDYLVGGTTGDYIDGGLGNDMMIGGTQDLDGNDTLLGNLGNDVLIGHHGKDRLFGNQGEDLIISGVFKADTHAVYQGLWNAWRGGTSIADRVQIISGVSNPAKLSLAGATITSDNVVDEVFGQTEGDWMVLDFGLDWSALQAGDLRTNLLA